MGTGASATTRSPAGGVTLRHGGKLHHIGLGYAEHNGITVRVLVHGLHVTVIHADTGEIIRDLELDPTRDYQPLGRKPGTRGRASPSTRRPPEEDAPDINEVQGQGLTMTRDFTQVGRRGLEPRTYGLKTFPIAPQATEYQAIATDPGAPGPSQTARARKKGATARA